MENRMRELDGLRGVAIILVMTGHIAKRAMFFSKHEVLRFITDLTFIGWVGVDIFFALSGFLITSILLRTRQDEHYFRNFYARRALRIFPLYFVFLLVFVLLSRQLDPGFHAQLPQLLPYFLTYLQNWIILEKGALSLYLFVTWSLAIEEQFYLIWPAVVYFARREILARICYGILILSIAGRIACVLAWSDQFDAGRFIYYNTFTRFEELVFGALLAIALTHPTGRERLQKISLPVFLASLSAFIGISAWSFPYLSPVSTGALALSAYTLAGLFTTALIAVFITHPERSLLRRVFQNKALGFFGKYSYSMYLLHLPILINLVDPFWDARIRGWKMYLGFILLTYVLTILGALLTWNLLEKPMLNLKKHFEHGIGQAS
jgi:peptidoglycan/LPS O-acetylase OafA/YrhL